MAECIKEQRMTLATIESERHLVQIGREMLGADAMPRSYDAALEQRECRVNGIVRDHKTVLVPDVLFGAVVNRFALRYLGLRKPRSIEHGFVGNDHVYIFA